MKRMAILGCICFVQLQAWAQVFYFDDTSALLIKTVEQSPAHWYLEILTNGTEDTTLRWKAHFTDVPVEWQINFDDQTNNVTVLDGDSADFTLFGAPEYPQKLIIGATLNNTPGHGYVYFDIYDPHTPSDVQTISYEFIISPVVGLEELSANEYVIENGRVRRKEGDAFHYQLMDADGRIIRSGETSELTIGDAERQRLFLLRLIQNDSVCTIKYFSENK